MSPRPATAVERARAARIRGRGRKATPADRQWLRDYDDARKALRAAAVDAPPTMREPSPVQEAAPSADTVPAGHVEVPFEAPTSVGAPPPDGFVVDGDDDDGDDDDGDPADSFEDDGTASTPVGPQAGAVQHSEDGLAAPVCGDPECPACSQHGSAHRCKATGVLVWRPLAKGAAKGLGRGMLAVIGFGIMLARSDRQFVRATDEEIAEMGEALREVTYRRMNGVGAISDIIEMGTAAVNYGVRAVAAPKLPAGGST